MPVNYATIYNCIDGSQASESQTDETFITFSMYQFFFVSFTLLTQIDLNRS